MAHASALLRWLSLGRRRSTRVCGARAPCRAGCGRFIPYGKTLHQRDLLPFGARSWCVVPAAAFFLRSRLSHLNLRGRLGSFCLGREDAAHELVSRWLWSVLVLSDARSLAEGLSPSACGHVVAYQERPPSPSVRFCASASVLGRALWLARWGEEAQHASSCCAGCVDLEPIEGRCTGGSSSPSACGRVVACHAKPACASTP